MRDLAKGQPLHQVEGYEAWRKGAVAAIDDWERAEVWEGELERAGFLDTVRLGKLCQYDDEVATLLADWAAFERQASERGMEALDLVTNDPLLTRVRRLVDATPDGEIPPQPLTGILARHQARIEKRENAASGIARALDDYRACHEPMQDTVRQLFNIGEWCRETERAINTWRAMTMTGERDPVLSAKAAALEELIAFEWRARNLRMRWNDARIASIAGGTADPFLQPDGEALAADLRSLQADLPRHAVMLSSLQTALAELDRHEARIAERDHVGGADHTRPSMTIRPATRRSMTSPLRRPGASGTGATKTRDAIDTWRAMTMTDARGTRRCRTRQRFLRTSSPSKDAPATFA